jgi:hypothetical protein
VTVHTRIETARERARRSGPITVARIAAGMERERWRRRMVTIRILATDPDTIDGAEWRRVEALRRIATFAGGTDHV